VAQQERAYERQTYQEPAYQQPSTTAPAPSAGDVVQQLKDIAELKHQGILTEEEFAAQKAKILGA
jgi:hypothetical protein